MNLPRYQSTSTNDGNSILLDAMDHDVDYTI